MNLIPEYLISGISLGFAYSLLALGFGLVFGTLRFLNFAHAQILMVTALIAYTFATSVVSNIVLALLVACAAGVVISVSLERVLIRPVVHKSVMTPFITTLGASLILTAVALKLWGSEPHALPNNLLPDRTFGSGHVTVNLVEIVTDAATLFSFGALGWFLFRTRAGLQVRALAQNPDAAATIGINGSALSTLTMSIAGVLAGVGGVLLSLSFHTVSPFIADIYGLKGLTAMIVGGIGSLRGSVVAGMAIGIGEVMIAGLVSSTWRDAVAFGLLIVVLLWRPGGLFGSAEERYAGA